MTIKNVQHLLPESIIEMINIIGLSETEKVVNTLGGLSVVFPKKNLSESSVLNAYREILGDDTLHSLWQYYAGCALYIPRCELAIKHLKKQRFINEVSEMKDKGIPITQAVRELCPKYQISDRSAWKALGEKTDKSTQKPLF